MYATTSYMGSHPKKGRPKIERKAVLDRGTPEIQYKRLMVTGKASTAHLSSTFVGMLHARNHLNELKYKTGLKFLSLSWSARCSLQSPALSKVDLSRLQELFGDRVEKVRQPPLLPAEFEQKDLAKLNLYFSIRQALDDLGKDHSLLALNVIQFDMRPPGLLSLLTDCPTCEGLEELKILKKALTVMGRVFKNSR